MRDEKRDVPETLDSLGEQIRALGKSIDARFAQVDARFAQVDTRFAQVDTRFDELKAQLGARIEAVDANVKLVYDVVIAQTDRNKANDKAHERFEKRLDDHDTRLLALEKPKPPTPEPAPPSRS